jgi:general secretion pathway protein K
MRRRHKRNRNEDGTVLISTLLVLSLMSAVALGLIATLRQSTQKAQVLAETAQADLYTQGAEDFARAQIVRLTDLDGPALNDQLRSASPILLPFENGSIAVSLRDGTHCLRLSALVTEAGMANDNEVGFLTGLLTALDVPPGQAARLSATIADWVDADMQAKPGGAEDGTYLFRDRPHRTANVPLSSVAELRAIDGMTEEIFQAMRPHICIGASGRQTDFNIDTARPDHLPVLAALLGGGRDGLVLAEEVLLSRPDGGFGSDEALQASPLFQDSERFEDASGKDRIKIKTDRIEIEALITFGQIERARVYGFDGIEDRAVKLTYRDWGRSAFRPAPVDPQTQETGQ